MTEERDKIPTDPIAPLDLDEPRTITKKTKATITITLADVDDAAKFLELVADLVRRGSLRITVE